MVFDDFPAEKVQDLMAFAKKESSQMSCGILSNTLGENPSAVGPASSSREGLPPRPQPSTSSHKSAAILSNTCKEKTSATEVSASPEANGSGKFTELIEFVGIFFSFFLLCEIVDGICVDFGLF